MGSLTYTLPSYSSTTGKANTTQWFDLNTASDWLRSNGLPSNAVIDSAYITVYVSTNANFNMTVEGSLYNAQNGSSSSGNVVNGSGTGGNLSNYMSFKSSDVKGHMNSANVGYFNSDKRWLRVYTSISTVLNRERRTYYALTVNFSLPVYTIQFDCKPDSVTGLSCQATGAGSYAFGSKVQIEAINIPAHHKFKEWEVYGKQWYWWYDNPHTLEINNDITNDGAYKTITVGCKIEQLPHSYTGAIKSDGNGKDATHSFKCVNGCNNYGNATKHTWNSGTVTKQPTCTATGVKTYTCTASGCGATYTETIPANVHTEVTIPAVAPTCTTTGLTEGKKCSVCGTIITAQQTVAALGHDYKSTVIAPTATSIGYTRHTCSRCGDYYDDSFTYFITFKNGDGTTLETVTVAHGNTPKCSKTPTKASTAEYSYTFNNTWSPALGAATANQVYTPNFTATKRSYRVRWFNEDGTLLETDTTLYGVMPTYDGATPTKAATAEFTYTFKGWHVEVKTVTGEFDYYARYTETTNKYKVTWKNDNGDVLEEDETEYGKIPTYDSAEPTKASTAEFTYTFAGWDTAISEVEGDIVYTATYTEHRRSYNLKVSYRESEGEVIGVVNGLYEYGTPLVATAKPKPGYKFLYWVIVSEDGTETTHTSNPLSFGIYCDTTLGAVFEKVPIPFKVNLEQVTGVYVVPNASDPDTGTIVYVISGTIPTVEIKFHTVDGWHFLVSNTIPDNSYPLEKLFVTDNKGNTTRIW